ncbi:MAG: hypothetical protein AAGM22_11790 [Acidobacteriota bacterium]
MQKHDGLWKELLKAFFPEFLGTALPKVAASLEGTKRRFLEQESFTDLKDGSHVRMDLVAEVPARGQPSRLVVVHIEVERSFSGGIDRRIFRYFAHLKLKFDLQIIPIVLFLRGGPVGIERRVYEETIEDFTVHRFSYCAVGLSRSALDDFLHTSALGPALGACTRGDRLPRYERKLRCLEALLDAGVNPAQQMLLLNAVETYLNLNENERIKYEQRVRQSPKSKEVAAMETTWADRLHEKGRREGAEEGRREGERQGLEVALRLLRQLAISRFGELPNDLARHLETLDDLGEISALSERVLRAGGPEDLGLADLSN